MGTLHEIVGWYALVADDDADWRAIVAQTLRRAGLQVCEAADGEELVARYLALRAITRLPIVVVSDIDMPGENGIEAVRDLRAASQDMPIVMMTGSSNPELKHDAERAGADVVLSKPLAPAVLRSTVTSLVEGECGLTHDAARQAEALVQYRGFSDAPSGPVDPTSAAEATGDDEPARR